MQLCWSVWASKQQVPPPLLSYKIAFCPLNQFQVAKLLIAVQFNFQVRIAFWIPNPISDFHPEQSDEENVFSWNPVSLEKFTKWGSKGHFAATQFRFILQNLTTNVTSSFLDKTAFSSQLVGFCCLYSSCRSNSYKILSAKKTYKKPWSVFGWCDNFFSLITKMLCSPI